MLPIHVALVSKTKKITASELSAAGAALQKQATRDLGPLWGISATVGAFPQLKDVPVGYYPIVIMDNIRTPGAGGFHSDKHHQPFARVQYDEQWTLTCSHEMCEMLVDPFGNRMVTSDSIKAGQGRVQYLVEVCDPCEDAGFAYTVNNLLVSDFYTPAFFDPSGTSGRHYSFTGSIKHPRQILKGGYLSWHDPQNDTWWQAQFFGGAKPVIKQLLGMERLQGSLRSRVDRLTHPVKSKPKTDVRMKAIHARTAVAVERHWEETIKGKK